jgi:hypothetical protein
MLDAWLSVRAVPRLKCDHDACNTATLSSRGASATGKIGSAQEPIYANSDERARLTSFLTALTVPALSLSVGKAIATRHSQRALRALAHRPRFIPAHELQQQSPGLLTQLLTEEHRQLLAQFRQVINDIHHGTARSDQEVQAWFMERATQLQRLYKRTPLVVKTLAFQILPLKAIPKLDDLSKPGAMMTLVRHIFYRCRDRVPWLLSNASLLTFALLIVILLVTHSYAIGKESRLALEADHARKLEERRKFLEMYPEGKIVDDPFWRETSVPQGQPFRGFKL